MFLVAAATLYIFWILFFQLNISPAAGGSSVIYIPGKASYEQAMDSVISSLEIKSPVILRWVSEKKNYPVHVKPGRYVVDNKMSYNGLINMLRSGRQTPVKMTFNNLRTLSEVAGRIGGQIDADSSEIMTFLSDPGNYSGDGFTEKNIIAVFIPNTYELFWNTGPGGLYSRMLREYREFWNSGRLKKAEEIGLTPLEVSTLASIVDEEAAKKDEMPRIAGVYLNRLKRGIPLQADPTVKFALNDFTITRVLKKHLQVDSPYNTYKYRGLPPGPIGCPTIVSIEAVLNAEENDYLFFAAKPDFSGYHNFSRTLTEHNRYASQYQRELNKRRIFR